MKAIIFAAGEGTRLRPLTYETPKPLLQIAGRSILLRIIDSLPAEVNEVFIVVAYLADKIITAIAQENFSKKITFVQMDLNEERGTWSALWRVKDYINDDNLFLVLNGDDLCSKRDLEKIILEKNWALAYSEKENPGSKYRNIKVDNDNFVVDIPLANETEKLINVATGIYLLDRQVFSLKPIKTSSGEWGLPQTLSQVFPKHSVKAVKMNDWIQINTVSDLDVATEYLKTVRNY